MITVYAAFEAALNGILAIDIYHYRVWWYYRLANDHESTSYSPKNRRYLPYHLLAKNRNELTLDNEPCNHVKREDIILCSLNRKKDAISKYK